jgi:HAD superfamily hydrolase (TIGR01509 family)
MKPGVREVLALLDKQGISAAVATSTGARRATHLLETSGIAAKFAAVVTGDQVARSKPAPDLFLEAARRCAVRPNRCLVVEDSDYGIIAARDAGMRSVFVRDLKNPNEATLALTDAQFASLVELTAAMGS